MGINKAPGSSGCFFSLFVGYVKIENHFPFPLLQHQRWQNEKLSRQFETKNPWPFARD